ncbi:DNA protecting protein DprA [Cyanobacterium stanieri PCC 7202]|uniref:DNA protecting protein DprA n=1 Tax=Cyanobacterium stanieri (strain ATCC 29140 / PCC 7202) TaxID=292563 RepID=K9YKI1_CYASC|nr:DNA protecting protein DprA [Cyanobacterium stanieri PCC 7202]
MINNQEKKYWLAWANIKGLGSTSIKKIYQTFHSLETAWQVSSQQLLRVDGIGKKLSETIHQQRKNIDPDYLFAQHIQKNPLFWTPADGLYPQLLLEIPSSPAILYYQGKVVAKENNGTTPLIGIVGTRKPTEHGRRWTYNISKALAQRGFVVVSGLAEGIDTVAHRGCLDGGGRTIAVLGNGLDRVYPPSNRALMAEIAEKGLILTEYAYGSRPERGNFPARNRIVAGLCRAILVMEAPEKSGALITAHYATEFNRDVYTLPNTPDNFQARGCLRLIHRGAEVIVTTEELLSSLGDIPDLDQPQQLSLFESDSENNLSPDVSTEMISPQQSPNLTPPLSIVYGAIALEPTSLDTIVTKTQLPTAQVSGILLQLELDGLITQLPGMKYKKH